MNKIELSQKILQRAGHYKMDIDGDFGPASISAANKYYDFPDWWDGKRISVGVIQIYAIRNNFDTGTVDGLWGQKTEGAYSKILNLLGIEKPTPITVDQDVIIKPSDNNWPSQNYNELVRFYGEVGTNQTLLTLPYEMKIAWDLDYKIKEFSCHKKVKETFGAIFEETLEHYGIDAIRELHLDLFGGCLNIRKMRGGSSWSMHSWGIAVDLDPDRNQLHWGKDKAYFARPEYLPFWKIVESKGVTSLGREKNYDWMHLQTAKL